MQQSEIDTIIHLISSNSLVLHLRDRQEIELKKSDILLEKDICHTDNLYIPCSEISHISVVTSDPKPKIKRKTVSQEIRLKLWQELKECGYKALFSGRVIAKENLMNHDLITIEHIVPLALNGSDCIENMTLEFADTNKEKGCLLPSQYKERLTKAERKRYNRDVNKLYQKKLITKEKFKNLTS